MPHKVLLYHHVPVFDFELSHYSPFPVHGHLSRLWCTVGRGTDGLAGLCGAHQVFSFGNVVRILLVRRTEATPAIWCTLSVCVWTKCTAPTGKKSENPRGTVLVTRMAALQAEQRRETQRPASSRV
jgi:hypothetical protein